MKVLASPPIATGEERRAMKTFDVALQVVDVC
jgi:hypothetical protein